MGWMMARWFGLALFAVSPWAAYCGDDSKLTLDGSTTVGPIAKAFAEHYMEKHTGVKITVAESGSGNGAKSLINSTCDAATMSRFMKPDEFKAAVEKGVLPVAHVVAMDGIAMIVHPANPIKALSCAQVADIYLGKTKNWNEVGGPGAPIVVVSRDTNSGTYETFEEKVMKKQKMGANVEYVNSNGAARQKVQSTEGAIAFVGMGFVDNTVKALVIDGVEASRQTVVAGKYPIARPLYLFTNGYPKLGSHLFAFVTMHLSKKGQEIVDKIGFVPVTSY
jgi:phosphate transport system substrate-binding protein